MTLIHFNNNINFMAIIKQSIIVLFSIISYSVGLDLFQVSKVDTQAASLNAAFVTFLLLFDKSTQNYTINQIFFFFFFFFLVQ